MYWEKELETLGRNTLQGLQLKRLTNTLRQAVNSPHYGSAPAIRRFAESGMSSIEQLRELPFTTKEQLRSEFPWGLLSTDKRNVIRLHSSSGTTGTTSTAGQI